MAPGIGIGIGLLDLEEEDMSVLSMFRAVHVIRPPQDFKDGKYAANQLSGFQEMSGAGATMKGQAGGLILSVGPGAHQLAEWDSDTQGFATSRTHDLSPENALPWYIRGTLSNTASVSPSGKQIAYLGMGSIHRNNFESDPTGALGYATTAVQIRYDFTLGRWELAVFDAVTNWDILAFAGAVNPTATAEVLYTPGQSIQVWLDGVLVGTYTDATHLANLRDSSINFSGLSIGVNSGSNASGQLSARWYWCEALHWRDF